MTDETSPVATLGEDTVSFPIKGDLSGVVAKFMVGLGVLGTLRSVWEVWIWQVDGFWDGVVEVLMPLFYLLIAGLALYSVLKGDRPEGLFIDDEGIVDRTKRLFSTDRVYWEEIKGIKSINQSFLGIPIGRSVFVLDVAESVFLRQPARVRFGMWCNRHLAGVQGIPLTSTFLPGDREDIMKVLQDRLDQYEIHSIAEAKKLDSGG